MESIFIIFSWAILLVSGFDDSVPPTGDKTFKIEYSDIVQSIKTISDETLDFWGFEIELKQNSAGILDIKIPKNFPTPASFTNSWNHGESPFVLGDNIEIAYEKVEEPCYFHYRMPVEGKKNVEISYTVILTGTWKLYSSIQFDEDDPCYNKVFYVSPIEPPLQQFKSGIQAEDIQCKEGLYLVIKASNGLPACVKPETKQKLIERGWANLDHPINSKLLPVRPLRVSYDEFADLLMGIKGDSIIEKQESESKITFITNMGNMEINKGLKSPAAIYIINKNPINMTDIDVVEYSKSILEDIGYAQDGTESITSIGSPFDSKITFTQLINGAYQNSHHTTFYFSSGYTKIELGRWYENISKIEFLVSNDEAKKIAYQYMQSEIETNPELQQRNMKAQIPTFSESLQIVDDRIAWYLDAAVGPNNHPEVDSPNYVGVLVDAMTGQVLGWDYGKSEV